VLQGIEVKKIKEFDNILPIFTKGELEGHKIPRQGISPYEAMYISKPADTELHEGVTDYMTFLPQVYNADSIGYRPDLVGHEVTEWKELIDPKFKGKAAILDVPAIGIMDAALCFESAPCQKRISKTTPCTVASTGSLLESAATLDCESIEQTEWSDRVLPSPSGRTER
jgi:hypothetical protein